MSVRRRGFVNGVMLGAGAVYSLRQAMRASRTTPAPAAVAGENGHAPLMPYGARAGDIAGLEGASLPVETPRLVGAPWLTRLAGGALTLFGLTRRGPAAILARTIGMGLLAKRRTTMPTAGITSTPESAPRPAPTERRHVMDIQKTFQIEAPLGQVYAFWTNYENFPLFMSNVRNVEDLGGGLSRWTVRGPGGAPIRWTARLTDQQPNHSIGWRSEPGAMLENAGVVRFTPEGPGTRIDLRFCYRPPIGAGPAVLHLLGIDPRGKVNEDINRLKSILEATVRSV